MKVPRQPNATLVTVVVIVGSLPLIAGGVLMMSIATNDPRTALTFQIIGGLFVARSLRSPGGESTARSPARSECPDEVRTIWTVNAVAQLPGANFDTSFDVPVARIS